MAENQDGIKLFNNSNDKIEMPSMTDGDIENQQSLVSENIEDKISQHKIKALNIKEDTVIAPFNYVFDFSTTDNISVLKRNVLKSLIDNRNGDTTLYLYGKSGLCEIGKGERYNLARVIPLIKSSVFDDTVRVYKDFQPNEPLKEVNRRDITKLRLNL